MVLMNYPLTTCDADELADAGPEPLDALQISQADSWPEPWTVKQLANPTVAICVHRIDNERHTLPETW
jgi:hypothetical protein